MAVDVDGPVLEALILVQCFAQLLSCLELWKFRGWDLDRFASPRITALRRTSIGNAVRSETNETDFVCALEGIGDPLKGRIDDLADISFRHAAFLGNLGNQIVLIHAVTPLD